MDLFEELKPIPLTKDSQVQILSDRECKNSRALGRALIVDCETTGLNWREEQIIEFSGVEVKYFKDDLSVYSVEPVFSCLKEPLKPLSKKIIEITGLTDADLKGHKFDLDTIFKVFERADFVLAHNMPFDRPFIESELPELRELDLRWGCTCHDGDWKEDYPQFTKKALGHLVKKSGYKFNAHRALDDCLATAFILHLHPEAARKIFSRATKNSFKVTFFKVNREDGQFLKDQGYGYRKGYNYVKTYYDVQEAAEHVAELEEKMRGKYKRDVKRQTPYSREAISF